MNGTQTLRAARGGRGGVLGVWSVLADPVAVEVAATSGAGYVCLDLQHGFAGPEQLPSLVRAARRGTTACLVRPAWNRPEAIMRALDSGADGVVVPMVETADDALAAVEACHYAPSGTRSWGPLWADVDGVPSEAPADDMLLRPGTRVPPSERCLRSTSEEIVERFTSLPWIATTSAREWSNQIPRRVSMNDLQLRGCDSPTMQVALHLLSG